MNIVAEKWDEIIHKLKIEYGLSNVSFRTWIEPLEVYNISDSTVYILVPLKSSVDYINQKYLLPFQVCIAEITGQEFEVKFITVDESQNINIKNQDDTHNKKNVTQNSIFEQANLNPKYTFDTFDLQSSLFIWRRWAWQDPSDAFHCTFYIRKRSNKKSFICHK